MAKKPKQNTPRPLDALLSSDFDIMPFYQNSHNFLHHFYFFRNREVDSIYFSVALIGFAGSLAGVFVPIFFWESGMPFHRILYFFLLNSAYFILFVFLFTPVIKRIHDKALMLISVPFVSVYYLGLNFFSEYWILFYILPAVHAISGLLFNMGYHTDFAGAADGDDLGKEIGMSSLISSLFNTGGPFLGGLIIASFGFQSVFFISTALLFVAIFPLFYFPKRKLSPNLSVKSVIGHLKMRKVMPFTISGAGYAAETMIGTIVWPVFLFLVLGGVKIFGGVMSLGMLAATFITFFMGFLSDSGKRRKVILWSSVLSSLIWIWRLFLSSGLWFSATQIAGRTFGGSLIVAWSSQYYKIARAIGDGSSFIVSRELLYHIVRVPFLGFLMVLSYYIPQSYFFKTSFVFAGVLTLLFIFANRVHTGSLRENTKITS